MNFILLLGLAVTTRQTKHLTKFKESCLFVYVVVLLSYCLRLYSTKHTAYRSRHFETERLAEIILNYII